jgi:hypothetical protein
MKFMERKKDPISQRKPIRQAHSKDISRKKRKTDRISAFFDHGHLAHRWPKETTEPVIRVNEVEPKHRQKLRDGGYSDRTAFIDLTRMPSSSSISQDSPALTPSSEPQSMTKLHQVLPRVWIFPTGHHRVYEAERGLQTPDNLTASSSRPESFSSELYQTGIFDGTGITTRYQPNTHTKLRSRHSRTSNEPLQRTDTMREIKYSKPIIRYVDKAVDATDDSLPSLLVLSKAPAAVSAKRSHEDTDDLVEALSKSSDHQSGEPANKYLDEIARNGNDLKQNRLSGTMDRTKVAQMAYVKVPVSDIEESRPVVAISLEQPQKQSSVVEQQPRNVSTVETNDAFSRANDHRRVLAVKSRPSDTNRHRESIGENYNFRNNFNVNEQKQSTSQNENRKSGLESSIQLENATKDLNRIHSISSVVASTIDESLQWAWLLNVIHSDPDTIARQERNHSYLRGLQTRLSHTESPSFTDNSRSWGVRIDELVERIDREVLEEFIDSKSRYLQDVNGSTCRLTSHKQTLAAPRSALGADVGYHCHNNKPFKADSLNGHHLSPLDDVNCMLDP